MFVTFDLCTDVTIDLDQITFWDFRYGETVDASSLSDQDKLSALNGSSSKYCIYTINEIFTNGDIGDYELLNVENQDEVLDENLSG